VTIAARHDLGVVWQRLSRQGLGRLKVLFRAFRDVSWQQEEERNDFHRLAEEAREHLAIVEGLLAGDSEAAAKAMAHTSAPGP